MLTLLLVALEAASPDSGKELSATVVFARASPSVVLVKGATDAGEVLGSGVVVAKDRVVTNLHVVQGARGLTVTFQGVQRPATVLANSTPKRDLALLEVALPEGTRIASLRAAKELTVGEHVFSIGNPRGLEQTLAEGLISALRPEDKSQIIQTSAAISPGSSGGGLFDAGGRLVGITTSMAKDSQNLNFAHPTDWVRDLLGGKSEPLPTTVASPWSVSRRPEHVVCTLKDRSTWGLFSDGLEVLKTVALEDVLWISHLEQSSVEVNSSRGTRRELVLVDMSRTNQVALFIGEPESLAVFFEDDGALRATLASRESEKGVARLVTRTGDCRPVAATEAEVAVRDARASLSKAGNDDATPLDCDADPVKCFARGQQVEGGERYVLFKRACKAGHWEACTEALKLADSIGDGAAATQLKSWRKRATVGMASPSATADAGVTVTPASDTTPKVRKPLSH